MKDWKLVCDMTFADEGQTARWAAELAPQVKPRQIWLLEGQVGAGKTTLMRHLVTAMGYRGPFQSPTYTLLQEYAPLVNRPWSLRHGDLYRIGEEAAIESLGLFEDFYEGPLFIEWGLRFPGVRQMATHLLQWQVKEEIRELSLFTRVNERPFIIPPP